MLHTASCSAQLENSEEVHILEQLVGACASCRRLRPLPELLEQADP